ncbi:MAG TPA: sugar phosphate isomerase/epimerase [Cyclobacteriaceae bacterium]|jgi:sugar phosphate isomerase/epimerase|nr:sugar phosphate isomerase/epimerase [Cyclobacteriaceae bacterium]
MKRRQFIQTAAVASAAAFLPSFAFAKGKRKIGIQLYTLRDVIFKDVQGTLKQVADFGYQELELFGYNDGKVFGKPVSEFAKIVKDLGMKITSGHYATGLVAPADKPAMVGTLSNGWEKAVNDAKTMGQEYMLVAYLQKDERKSMDDYKKVCELINKNAEICKKYGIKIGYHNHDFEFEPIDGQVPYDLMLKELDPKLVSLELDLFWTIYANQDPIKLFEAHPGRFEQWHVKDMSKDDRKRNADVGTGTIDFKAIFAKAELSGMKHFYIEHDNFPGASIDSVKADAQNIKSIIS